MANKDKAIFKSKLAEMWDVLSSARCIAHRKGKGTDWKAWDARLGSLGVGIITAKVFIKSRSRRSLNRDDNS